MRKRKINGKTSGWKEGSLKKMISPGYQELLDLVESEIDNIISKVNKTPLPEEMVIAHLKKNTLTIPKDKVKGWPNHLAIGTVTDNSVSVNRYLVDGKVDSIFKYAGNGFGDRGKVITPSVTLRTIEQARNVEKS